MANIPKRFERFVKDYPAIGAAYQALGDAASEAGPLDAKSKALIKLGIAVGNRHDGAIKSHTRRSLEAGATPEEIRHAVILSATTIGFPNMMAALSSAEKVLEAD